MFLCSGVLAKVEEKLPLSEITLLDGISEEESEEKNFGIINLSVATLCVNPDFSSEIATQALLGMPVRVLEEQNWYRIQTPDNYVAWVHRAALCLVSRDMLAAWNRAEKIVVTALQGTIYSQPRASSQPLSDVVAGNRLKWEGKVKGFYKVAYPDGRLGYISQSIAMPEKKWRAGLKQNAADLIHTAYTLMGIPYIWGGTSSKGMDCSGFIRTILFLHDIIIPRDASQQAQVGERIDIATDFANLQPGDLLFFGTQATSEQSERVLHVAMYIGNKRFIHSQGDVHISSFDPVDSLFDAFNLERLLFAARLLPYINKEPGINTTITNPYYATSLQ